MTLRGDDNFWGSLGTFWGHSVHFVKMDVFTQNLDEKSNIIVPWEISDLK